jgi:hypothetical protein
MRVPELELDLEFEFNAITELELELLNSIAPLTSSPHCAKACAAGVWPILHEAERARLPHLGYRTNRSRRLERPTTKQALGQCGEALADGARDFAYVR